MKRPNWYSSGLDGVPYGAGVRDHPVVFHGLHDGDRIALDPSDAFLVLVNSDGDALPASPGALAETCVGQ